jgi:hypothetical protein
VLQAEVESLCRLHWPDREVRFLSSMMHVHPERLASTLQSVLHSELKQEHRVVLIYGDCCAQMAAAEAMPGVVRTRGRNCCELLLGSEDYRRLSREGAFFLIPEWACRWKEVFVKELGLNRENATSLMQDMHRRLVYLDTGLVPVPVVALEECAEYCGLPYMVRPVSLELLNAAVQEALLRCSTPGTPS